MSTLAGMLSLPRPRAYSSEWRCECRGAESDRLTLEFFIAFCCELCERGERSRTDCEVVDAGRINRRRKNVFECLT